jgi:hypothetical protein
VAVWEFIVRVVLEVEGRFGCGVSEEAGTGKELVRNW